MSFNLVNTKDIEQISDFVAASINRELDNGHKVLWFATGGSSIKIESRIAQKIHKDFKGELVITLTDERFGNLNHPDSNWFQLKESGFDVPSAKFIPFLNGKSFRETVEEIRVKIKEEFEKADYKIGMFGLGIDGHIAGILPRSDAVHSDELICAYDTPQYDRITITPHVISKLDEAVMCALGDMKWPMIEKFEEDWPIDEVPSQILKSVPLLTIFSDYKKE